MKLLNSRIVYAVLFAIFCTSGALAQKMELVAANEVLPTIIAQPNSPLRIEEFLVVRHRDTGQISADFTVRNISKKVVKEYLIMIWYDTNTGWTIHGTLPQDRRMLPGQTFSLNPADDIFHGPIKKYNGKLKRIAFAMVYSAIFEDGTEYSAAETSKALRNRLEEYDIAGQ